MKTVDLIPIILYQLIDGDRYGYEIIKQIEDASGGNLVIKQPTLYSVLKKLEQGRFISSYWQDSEIGGKRHYYKLTDNGKSQLTTYPPLKSLINDILIEDGVVAITTPVISEKNANADNNKVDGNLSATQNFVEEQPHIVTIDISEPSGIKQENISTPQPEVVIDLSANQPSSPALGSIFDAIDEPEKVVPINIFDVIEPEVKDDQPVIKEVNSPVLTTASDLVDEKDYTSPLNPDLTSNSSVNIIDVEKIPFLNYIDLRTDHNAITRRNAVKKHIQKMSLTCFSLLVLLVLSAILCDKFSFGKVYYVGSIISVVIIVLYPVILLKNLSQTRLKYCTSPFTYSLSRDFFIKLSMFLIILVVVFAYNLSLANMVMDIFKSDNFANFYAPIMLASAIILDFIYSLILYKPYKETKNK